MNRIIYLFVFFSLLIFPIVNYAQSYNTENVAWVNYLIRMYENAPFEGVRIVDDYKSKYLISVLALDKNKYEDAYSMSRVASVKASSQASKFFNGSTITSECVIRTKERLNGKSDTEILETINEHSIGYVKSLQYLTNFEYMNKVVFIYSTPIRTRNTKKFLCLKSK